MSIRDGFPGQRMLVLPRPRVREFLSRPSSTRLVVTDCGYFPHAQYHGRSRPTPINQLIVMVCASGAGWCRTESGRFAVTRGDAVTLPAGSPHAYGADASDPWTLWWFHVAGPDVCEFAREAGMTIAAPVRRPSNLYRIVSLVTEIVEWMERDLTTSSLLAASGAAWHTLTALVSDLEVPNGSAAAVDEASGYLRRNLQEHFSVPELAAMAGLSASHFAALFKRRTGYSVLQYQTHLRMARARELLDTTNRPIAAVAAAVGYLDAFYFTRQFRRIHGVTPREYRQHLRG